MPTLISFDWSGNIQEVHALSTEAQAANYPNLTRVDVPVNPALDYYDLLEGKVKTREPWELNYNTNAIQADGEDVLVLSDLPIGTQVFCQGSQYTVNDGVFEYTTDDYGPFNLRIVPPKLMIKDEVFYALEP